MRRKMQRKMRWQRRQHRPMAGQSLRSRWAALHRRMEMIGMHWALTIFLVPFFPSSNTRTLCRLFHPQTPAPCACVTPPLASSRLQVVDVMSGNTFSHLPQCQSCCMRTTKNVNHGVRAWWTQVADHALGAPTSKTTLKFASTQAPRTVAKTTTAAFFSRLFLPSC